MSRQCLHPDTCPCTTASSRIVASNNAIGIRIASYHPEVLLTSSINAFNFGYCAANDDRDDLGVAVRRLIAELEGVKVGEVQICGSLLELFTRLPRALGCRTIVKVAGDFAGYARGSAIDIPLVETRPDLENPLVDPSLVSETVRDLDKPMVFLTFPVTNPFQQTTPVEAAGAVLEANPEAIVVLDNAYRGYGQTKGLVSLALAHGRVIYVQTAAKDLLLCGGRFGWAITSPTLREKLSQVLLPFTPSPASLEQGRRLLLMPSTLESMRKTQTKARDILSEGISRVASTRSGPAPWILVDFGTEAANVTEELRTKYRVDVLQQAAPLLNWVRISATVPCEAHRIVDVITEVLMKARVKARIIEILKTDASVQNTMMEWIQTALDQQDNKAKKEIAALWGPLLGYDPRKVDPPA